MGRRPAMALFFPPHPYAWREMVDTFLHRHPYALLYSLFNFSPKSMSDRRHTITTLTVLKEDIG